MTGSSLGPAFSAALRCGSLVRAETTIGAQGRSLGHRAVDLGLAALGPIVDPAIIVVGSGRMAGSAVEHLTRLGRRPRVAARNEREAIRLAGPSSVCPLSDLSVEMAQADLLICATSATHHVVTLDHVRAAMSARSRPLVVVDLSVPRNVDASVTSVPGVRLIDLEGMSDDAATDPGLVAALAAGDALVCEASRQHMEAVAARRAGPVIAALRSHVEETCLAELTKIATQSLTPESLAGAAHAIAGKLLHHPTLAARAAAVSGDADALSFLCDIFGVRLPAAEPMRLQVAAGAPTGCLQPDGAPMPDGRIQPLQLSDAGAPGPQRCPNPPAPEAGARHGTPGRREVLSSAVEIVDLVKRYGDVTALDGISLNVPAGSVLALLGPNGAGKTSAVEICEGFRRPDGGRVRVLGRNPQRDSRALRPRVGVMLQGGGAYPAARCGEMLRLVACFARHPHDPTLLLEALGLASVANTPVKQLSGGQRQRLSLAMAIVGRPELVFLDEPTAGLDPAARHATWEVVDGLRRDGATVVLTTHFMDEAERLADTVAILDHGRVVAQGTPNELTQTDMAGRVRFQAAAGLDISTLTRALPGNGVASEISPGEYLVESDDNPALLTAVAGWCAQQNVLTHDMRVQRRSLEDAFLDLTGRARP